MPRLITFVFMVSLAISALAATEPPNEVWWETDGLVVLEIESVPPARGWIAETDMTGFTGSTYYTWRGGDNRTPGVGTLTYRVMILTPGTWHLRIRNRHDFHDKTEQNDSYVQVDDGPWIKCFSYIRGRWNWISQLERSHSDKRPASYELGAGEHIIRIAGRSDGFSIDRIHLYRDGAAGSDDASRQPSRAAPNMPTLDAVPRIAEAWSHGRLGQAMALAERASTDDDATVAAQATAAVETLRRAGEHRLGQIEASKAARPAAALTALASLAGVYAGSDFGDELRTTGRTWQREPAVRDAIAVHGIIEGMREISGRLSDGDRSDSQWLRRNQRHLRQLASAWQQLTKRYPNHPQLSDAETLLTAAGITPPASP